MEEDILGRVIEVEKEVQQKFEIEKKMSQEWLENVKKDAEKKVLAEEKDLKEAFHEAIKKAKLDAEKKAADIIKDADEEAERLKGLGDEILKKVILSHIYRILPG